MDFPSTPELDSKTVFKIIHSMSALDARKAFKEERKSRFYHVLDVNMSGLEYHSARADTVAIVDDNLTLLVPDQARDCASFTAYEIPITQEISIENHHSPKKQMAYVKICWKDSQGYVVLRGKKEKIGTIRLQFAQDHSQEEFCDAFDNSLNHLAQHTGTTQSQEQPQTTQRLQSIVVSNLETPGVEDDCAESDAEHENCASKFRAHRSVKEDTQDMADHASAQIPSGPLVEEMSVSSDVFAFPDDNEMSAPSPTAFSRRLRLESGEGIIAASLNISVSSHDGDCGEVLNEMSSPLKKFGRCVQVGKATLQSNVVLAANPTMSEALNQQNDDNFAAFFGTATRANAAPVSTLSERPKIQENQDHQELTSETPANMKARSAHSTTTPSTRKNHQSKRAIEADHASGAPSKRLKTALSTATADYPKPSEQDSVPAMSTNNAPKRVSKAVKSKAANSLRPLGDKSAVSDAVDWDEDLRTDNTGDEKQGTRNRSDIVAHLRKPLKDVTNFGHASMAGDRRKISIEKKGPTKVRRTTIPKPTSPTRRSQRTMTNKATSYAESSGSEIDNMQHGVSGDETSSKLILAKHRSPTKFKSYKPTREVRSKTKPPAQSISTRFASQSVSEASDSQNVQQSKTVIVVPSSDDEDDEESSELVQASVQRPNNHKKGRNAPSANGLDADSIEVLEDSYPQGTSALRAVAADGDRSFGTKLNDMIATEAMVQDGNVFQAVSAPFGDQEQFVHNINTARKAKSPDKELSPALSLQPTAAIRASETMEIANSAESEQALPQSLVSDKALAANDEITFAVTSHRDSTELSIGCKTVREAARDVSNSRDQADKASDHINNVSEVEKKTAEKKPLPIRETLQESEPQRSQKKQNALVEHDKLHHQQQISRHQTSPDKRQTIGISDTPQSTTRSRRDLATPVEGNQKCVSRTVGMKALKQKAPGNQRPDPAQLSVTASSKAQIVHFSSAGPSVPKKRSDQKSKPHGLMRDEECSKTSTSLSKLEIPKRQVSTNSTATHNERRSMSECTDFKDMNLDPNDLPSMISSYGDETRAFADEHNAVYVTNESDPDQALAEPEAPAISQVHATEPEVVNRRSDPQTRSRQTASVVQPAAYLSAEVHSSVHVDVEDRVTRPLFPKSVRVTSGCISLAEAPMAEPDSFHSEKCPEEFQADGVAHESDCRSDLQREHQQPHDTFRTTAFQKPTFVSTTKLSSRSVMTLDHSDSQTSRDQVPPIAPTRLPGTGNTLSTGQMLQINRSPLFPLQPVARNIFAGRNKQPEEAQEPKKSHSGIPVITAQNASVATSVPVKVQAEAGPGALRSQDTVPQNRTIETTANSANSRVSDSETLSANERSEAAPDILTLFGIVRLRRQDPSPAQNSSTLVAPMNSPQAFLERLHAPISPIPGKYPPLDTPEGQISQQGNLEHAGRRCADKRRASPYSNVPFAINMLRRQVPLSSPGSESEADLSLLTHTHQHDRGASGSANRFASMVEENMLAVVLKLADRIEDEENSILKQADTYQTGSVEIVEDLRRNSAACIKHEASKLMTTIREQLQQAAEANAQLARMTLPNSRSGQISDTIERQKQDLYEMLDNVRS